MTQSIIRTLINSQKYLSEKFDSILPSRMKIFANHVFDRQLVPSYLKENQIIYDIGGGKLPNITADQKEQYNLKIIGMDISQEELDKAQDGMYHKKIAADITQYSGNSDGDLVLCRALLEHVQDVEASLKNIKSVTKPGGHIIIFVPCRNALFTRINMILSDEFKRKLLKLCFPGKHGRLGFTAYYDRCTPKQFEEIAENIGLKVEETTAYYNSQYFSVLTPVHIIWRLYQLAIFHLGMRNFCEAYTMILSNPE